MLKKKFKLQTQFIITTNAVNKGLNTLLISSFKRNQYLPLLTRVCYFSADLSETHSYNYTISYYNTVCPNSLSVKVPNSKYLFSRFFINNQYNKLTISNIAR